MKPTVERVYVTVEMADGMADGLGVTVDVYVLDMSCDHADGGDVDVFSSEEKAKAAVPHVKEWERQDDGSLLQVTPGQWDDAWYIYKRTVDKRTW